MTSSPYRTLYNALILPILWGGSRALSFASPKLRAGLAGRKGLVDRVRAFRSRLGSRPVLLFHCASAGEFEALRPLAQEFDRNKLALAVSYFSPSAKNVAGKSTDFDFADYSPIDSPRAVTAYLDALMPSVIAITKHDIWPNLVWEAEARAIPVFLINGNFHAKSMRLWPGVRPFHGAVYAAFAEIMTVSEEDAKRARRIVGNRVLVRASGDSRFDRVLSRVQNRAALPDGVEEICKGRPVLVAGSTHVDDEQLLMPALPELLEAMPDLLTVIVPHDPSQKAANRIADFCIQYNLKMRNLDTQATSERPQVLVINRSGILADLYRVGQVAYVGGGFGKGVHSVLEPMASGLPVMCGPNIVVSNEAGHAQSEELLTVVTGRKQVVTQTLIWLQQDKQQQMRSRTVEFVRQRAGVAKRIAVRLREAMHV